MALTLSTGLPEWMGHETKGIVRRVAYVALEGGFDLGQRVDAWCKAKGAVHEDAMRFFVEQSFNLMDSSGYDTLMDPGDFNPDVVFIDTQTLAAPKVEENDNSQMTELMSRVKLFSQAMGCIFILVHHTGHQAEGRKMRERGASAQFANMDVSMMVHGSKDPDGLRRIEMRKLKSGPLVPDMGFRLQESGKSVYVTPMDVPEEIERILEDDKRKAEEADRTWNGVLYTPAEMKLLDWMWDPEHERTGVILKDVIAYMDVAEQTARKYLKKMEQGNLVRKEENKSPIHGGWMPTVYLLGNAAYDWADMGGTTGGTTHLEDPPLAVPPLRLVEEEE